MSSGQSVWVEKEAEIWRFGSDAKMQMVQTTSTEDAEAEKAADNGAEFEEKGEKKGEECTVHDEFGRCECDNEKCREAKLMM